MKPSTDRILPAIALRLASVLFFAAMSVGIKLAEQAGAALGEILFFRQFAAMLLVSAFVARGPGFASLATHRMGAHIARTTIGLAAMALSFEALLLLPLAEATTLGFSMPIFATILGAIILGEPTGGRRWAAVLAGFIGVVIVVQPGSGHFSAAGLAFGLSGALGSAAISILLRQIGRTEQPLTTVFWFSALSLVPLGLFYAFVARAHPPLTWAILIGIGLVGGVAQITMTRSLSLGAVSAVVPMDYTALLWATLFGWLIFDRLPAPATWAGAPIIVASGLYIVWREHRRQRAPTRQAMADGIG